MASNSGVQGVVAALVASAGLAAPALAQIEWDNASGGEWNTAANWNPMTVPGAGQSASIALPGTYDVLIRSSVTINSLLFTNPNATVGLGVGRDLRLENFSSIIDGTLILNDQGSTSGARLLIGHPMLELNGAGQIILNDTSTTAVGRAQVVDAAALQTTTIGPNLLIRGSGQLNFVFDNTGTIRADALDRELAIIGSPKTNDGDIGATDGGLLRIQAQIDQGPTGRIIADGGEVRLINTIAGGEIDSTNGLFEVAGGSGNLNGVALVTGDIELENGRDLFIRDGITMDGTIVANREGGVSGARVLMGTSGTLEGDMTVRLNDSSVTAIGRAQFVDAMGGITTTLADTVAIRGSGQINANIINDGTISADASGLELAIIGVPKANNGLIEATGGGLLRVGTTVNQTPEGRIVADGGEIRLISTIEGGQIDSTNGLFEIEGGSGNLNNIDLVTGDIEIQNGRDLFIRGGITMNGEFLVNRDTGTSGSRLLMATSGTLDGNMVITLNDSSDTATGRAQFIDAVGGLTTTLAETVLIQGSGQVNSVIVNEGTISANVDSRELAIVGNPKTNNNLMEATGGGLLRIATRIDQGPTGRIVADGGEVRLINNIVGGEIDATNGLFEVAGGSARFTNVDRVTGPVEIQNGRDLFMLGDLTLDGTIIVNRDASTSGTRLLPDSDGTIDGNGEIFLNDSAPTSVIGRAQLTQAVGGITTTLDTDTSLTGNGQINGTYVVRGTLSPGRAGSAVGESGILRATGTMTMEDSTVVRIQIGGRADGEFDEIDGTSAITVDGTLEAAIIDGFAPDICENFVVISGSSISGTFDTFVPPPVASNIRWRLFYGANTVELRATCVADIDGDCTLTVFDFLAFQNLFAAGSVEADFDGDGSLSIFDFLAYQNAFAAGCS